MLVTLPRITNNVPLPPRRNCVTRRLPNSALGQNANYLVGGYEQRVRYGKADRFGDLHVDDGFKLVARGPADRFDKSMNLQAKGFNQLLHLLDLVSHKPAHLLRCAAGYNVTVFGQLGDQIWSMRGNHEFPV
jgi:hypothetical protein